MQAVLSLLILEMLRKVKSKGTSENIGYLVTYYTPTDPDAY